MEQNAQYVEVVLNAAQPVARAPGSSIAMLGVVQSFTTASIPGPTENMNFCMPAHCRDSAT